MSMSYLEEWYHRPTKYQYRIVESAYAEPYESGHFYIQYKNPWSLFWEIDGHWSSGMSGKFYRKTYHSLEDATKAKERFIAHSHEPLKTDKIHS